jgi:hypothetical protein
MTFFANVVGWIFRGIAYVFGRDRVVCALIRSAEKSGNREMAELIRSKYFALTGTLIRLDAELPANGSHAANPSAPEAK